MKNFKTGADLWQWDTVNVNFCRDFTVDILGDIAIARVGDYAIGTRSKLQERRGVEVGNIFQLGTWYSDKMEGASFTGIDGKSIATTWAAMGLGLDALRACIKSLRTEAKQCCLTIAMCLPG